MKIEKIMLTFALVFFLFVSFIAIVFAIDECKNPLSSGDTCNIEIGPLHNASNANQFYTSATCTLYIINISGGSDILTNAAMSHLRYGIYNYTYTFSTGGIYPWFANCTLGTDAGLISGTFYVNTSIDKNFDVLKNGIQSNQTTITTQINGLSTGVQSNATDIKTNISLETNEIDTTLLAVQSGIQNNATAITTTSNTRFGHIDTNLTEIDTTLSTIRTGISTNSSWLNTTLTSGVWSYVLSSLGFSAENTMAHILHNITSSYSGLPQLFWQYRLNTTTCDTNITVNESPQACGQLNSVYKRS